MGAVSDPAGFTCGYCGAMYAEPPDGFLFVELETSDGDLAKCWYPGFCSAEHAAGWFGRPMPPPDQAFNRASPAGEPAWLNWLGLVGGGLLVLGILAFAVVGAVSVLG